MTVPTKIKTWNAIVKSVYNSNVDIGNRMALYEIKAALITGDGAWTVVGSSDSVNASMDGTDRWTDYTKIVYSTGAHSWIVLEQSGLAGGFQIVIDCNQANTSTEKLTLYVSQGGNFANGDISNRPTAPADEQVVLSGSEWGGSSSNFAHGVNVLKTSDGSCTRVALTYGSVVRYVWFFDTPKNPASWWASPYLVAVKKPDRGTLFSAAGFKTRIDGANVNLYLSGETYTSLLLTDSSFFEVPDYGGEWLILPMGVVSSDATRKGRIGECFDLWWIPTNWPEGFYIAGSGDRDFVSMGDVLFAWTGDSFALT